MSLTSGGNFLHIAEIRVISAFILKRAKKQSSNAASQAGRLAISYLLFIAAGMGLMLLLQFLFWPGRGVMMNQSAPSTARESEPSASGKNPPWGQLEYLPIALDRPEDYFNQELGQGMKPVWIFRNHTEQQLT